MCVPGTPVEHHPQWGLYVKREDLCCPTGPHFSKTRGVYAHIAKRPEGIIGCLDTGHSQGGWATAQACRMLGKKAVVYYPEFKKPRPMQPQQLAAADLGASLIGLTAGRSAVMYHAAKRALTMGAALHNPDCPSAYMMPNALKLPEMIEETVAEVLRTPLPPVDYVIISASSGTIAAGVISGLCQLGWVGRIIVHMGYSRGEGAVRNYMDGMVAAYSNQHHDVMASPDDRLTGQVRGVTQVWRTDYEVIDECYEYGDYARDGGLIPSWPCNRYYDLKAFQWWVKNRRNYPGDALLWNVG